MGNIGWGLAITSYPYQILPKIVFRSWHCFKSIAKRVCIVNFKWRYYQPWVNCVHKVRESTSSISLYRPLVHYWPMVAYNVIRKVTTWIFFRIVAIPPKTFCMIFNVFYEIKDEILHLPSTEIFENFRLFYKKLSDRLHWKVWTLKIAGRGIGCDKT